MENFIDIINQLKILERSGAIYDDVWSSLSICGDYQEPILAQIVALNKSFLEGNLENIFQIDFDGEKVRLEDFNLYENGQSFKKWKIVVNKYVLIEKRKNEHCNINFFLSPEACQEWFGKINPIEEENPIFQYKPLKIYTYGILESFGNGQLEFVSLTPNTPFSLNTQNPRYPTDSKLKETIHFISKYNIYLSPATFELTKNIEKENLFQIYVRHSSITLACCIVNEFYDFDKIILDGIRRISLKIYNDNEHYDYKLYEILSDIVIWIYEDRATTRRKLFNDRFTLEINDKESLITNIKRFGELSLLQAKERYNFVILERKDAYVKELKELLKDLRSQSDLYSQKIRTLLSNFLRDVLASIVLIGFTIFTKFSENIGLDKHKVINYVFGALGIYYIISIVLQSIIDVIDISITSKELRYWKKASNELLPEKEFDNYYKESLKGRRFSLRILYPIIAILYIVLAICCFKFPRFFEELIN